MLCLSLSLPGLYIKVETKRSSNERIGLSGLETVGRLLGKRPETLENRHLSEEAVSFLAVSSSPGFIGPVAHGHIPARPVFLPQSTFIPCPGCLFFHSLTVVRSTMACLRLIEPFWSVYKNSCRQSSSGSLLTWQGNCVIWPCLFSTFYLSVWVYIHTGPNLDRSMQYVIAAFFILWVFKNIKTSNSHLNKTWVFLGVHIHVYMYMYTCTCM